MPGAYRCTCRAGYAEDGVNGCVAACSPRGPDAASLAFVVGHTDLIAVSYAANDLALFVSDDSFPIRQETAVQRKPEAVLVYGNPAGLLVVPDIPALSGLLVPDTEVWILPEGQPEAQSAALPWPGFQSYGVARGAVRGDEVIVRLVEHDGEGAFIGFATVQDEFTPPDVYFDSARGPSEFRLPVETHVHMNWAFTRGGLHRLVFELEATPQTGGKVTSQRQTYRFFFGDLPDLPATEPTIVVPRASSPSYSPGQVMQLSAVRHGASSILGSAWSRQCYEPGTSKAGPWEPLASGDVIETPARASCQYMVCLLDGANAVAASQAIMPRVE